VLAVNANDGGTMGYTAEEQELLGQLDEGYPESWNYKEPGHETIVGKVIAQREVMVNNQRTGALEGRLIAVLQSGDGHKATVWITSVLSSQFSRERVSIGDIVAIKYEGLKTPEGGGNEYHNFSVRVKKPEGTALSWGDPSRGGGRRASDPQPQANDADFGGGADDDIPF
jgi:hypothetical protein